MLSKLPAAAVWTALFTLAAAQSYTSCDPMEKTTCPDDTGTTESQIHYDFTSSSDLSKWTTTAGTVTSSSEYGAEFTISEKGDSPTIETDFYIFFGEVTVNMQAAPGTGIVSSAILESDDLDEIDWEMLGGYTAKVQTDYYGKGDSSSYDRWTWEAVSNPQTTFHTYKWVWTESQLTWSIDGTVVRTLTYEEAVKGTRYPQTPMRVRLGIWAGGDSDNNSGTIEWAGGETDYSDGPFTMYVNSVTIVNYNPATSYTWTDETGSMDSIQINGGSSTSVSSPSSSGSSSDSSGSSTATVPASVAAASGALWRSEPSGAAPAVTRSSIFVIGGSGALILFSTICMILINV